VVGFVAVGTTSWGIVRLVIVAPATRSMVRLVTPIIVCKAWSTLTITRGRRVPVIVIVVIARIARTHTRRLLARRTTA